MHEEHEIAEPMRDLVGGNGEGGQQAQGPVLQKGGGNENAVQHVVNAVPDENQRAGGLVAVRVAAVMRVAE